MLSNRAQLAMLFSKDGLITKSGFPADRLAFITEAARLADGLDLNALAPVIVHSLDTVYSQVLAIEILVELGAQGLDDQILLLLEVVQSPFEIAILAISLSRLNNLKGFAILEDLYKTRLKVDITNAEERESVRFTLEKIIDTLEFDISTKAAKRFRDRLRKIDAAV